MRLGAALSPGSLSSNFIIGNSRDSRLSWRSFQNQIPIEDFSSRGLRMGCGKQVVKAVSAFLDTRAVVENKIGDEGFSDSQQGESDSESLEMRQLSISGEALEVDEKERLRRTRISKANKGNTPWNKGRKHSPETIRKIREHTKRAMQDPKVKKKLVTLGHAQSEETKLKIGIGVRKGWERHRVKLKQQETCYFEWQNLIAEASRSGLLGEKVLDWDSYKILDSQLLKDWFLRVEMRKKARTFIGDKRAPKTAEQKKRISQAISAKWNDPAYRDRVCSALAKHYGIQEGGEKKPRRKVNGERPTRKRVSLKKKPSNSASLESKDASQSSPTEQRRSKGPLYKDPTASSKLQMIKNIRAQRTATDAKKTEAIERARLLIAEAEKAANALEIAAKTNPVARDSLIEARKLIKEANQAIGFQDVQRVTSITGASNSLNNSNKPLVTRARKVNDPGNCKMNGTDIPKKVRGPAASDQKNRCSKNLQDLFYSDEKLSTISPSKYDLSRLDFERLGHRLKQTAAMNGAKSHPRSVKSQTPKKRWIRGKLVEVMEE